MIELNDEAKKFVNDKLKEISKKNSIPLEGIKNFYSAFILYEEMCDQIRHYLEKRNMDKEASLEKLLELRCDMMAISLSATFNPKLVDVYKAIIQGDMEIEDLEDDK